MRFSRALATLLPCLAAVAALVQPAPATVRQSEHVVVWRQPNRYGGWPANHGIWSWGDEILVGFSAGHMKPGAISASGGPARHPIDRSRPEQHLLARSLDGGRTWAIEHPAGLIPPPEPGHIAGVPTEPGGRGVRPYAGAADLASPDFVMTFRMSDIHAGPSWFFTSADRGRTWDGPWALSLAGVSRIAARTDYVVMSQREAVVLLTSAKSNGREGRPFAAWTADGGRSFELRSWIGPEPDDGFVIMPSTARLDARTLVTATRRQGRAGNGIDIHRSVDAGRSWTFVTTAVEDTGRGNPPSLVRLRDGRLALTYGYRASPFGIRARLSRDGGRSWETERVLRDDASDWDLGYTRSVQRADGRIVTVYYYNDNTAPERYIAATIWDPGA
jgi:hypothetical protein